MIAFPMILMFILGFVFCLLINPYIRKLLHEKTDHDFKAENKELRNKIKQLKKQV